MTPYSKVEKLKGSKGWKVQGKRIENEGWKSGFGVNSKDGTSLQLDPFGNWGHSKRGSKVQKLKG